jgi:hypothetical protein
VKPLRWDVMRVCERYRVLQHWDVSDVLPMAVIVDLPWESLPADAQWLLRWL